MSIERWNKFTLKQQFGNIAAELGRAKKQLELDNTVNYNLSLGRVIEMLGYQKINYSNSETYKFYEYIDELKKFPDIDKINDSIIYSMSFVG